MFTFAPSVIRIPASPRSIRLISGGAPQSSRYEYLKTCTSRRWVVNNDAHLALRKLNFDVEALGNAAANAKIGASRWTNMKLIAEGKFNRVIGITLDNGDVVVARLPFASAGPRNLMTCSEVATMDFLRTRLNAPVPEVLAWDASPNNDVGTEYIIMEKCPGEPMSSNAPVPFYARLEMSNLITQLVTIPFSQYGSIYYKEDVDIPLQQRPLYADTEHHDECSERFRIGPSVEKRFYRGERAQLCIDRGPWTDLPSYLKAIADCEIRWIEAFSSTPAAQIQPGATWTPQEHIAALKEWLDIFPTLLPAPQYCIPILSHVDTGPNDILRLPNGDHDHDSVYSIIDWQTASVKPLFETALSVPIPLGKGDLKGERVPDEIWKQMTDQEGETDLFPTALRGANLQYIFLLRYSVNSASNSWSEGLPPLKMALPALADIQDSDNGIPLEDKAPLPEEWDHLFEQVKDLGNAKFRRQHIQECLEKEGISLSDDGSVDVVDFEKAKAIVKEIQEGNIALRNPLPMPRDEWSAYIHLSEAVREGDYDSYLETCI